MKTFNHLFSTNFPFNTQCYSLLYSTLIKYSHKLFNEKICKSTKPFAAEHQGHDHNTRILCKFCVAFDEWQQIYHPNTDLIGLCDFRAPDMRAYQYRLTNIER